MNYVIAVRSYDRASLKRSKTINTLRTQNLLTKTTVFVVQEQLEEYKLIHDDVFFQICQRGCTNATKAICEFFPVDTPIVFMDDDLDKFSVLQDGKLESANLEEMIIKGFSQPLPWTVGFMSNTFWMVKKKVAESKPAMLNGSFFAMRNDPDVCIISDRDSHNDDILRTCKVLNKYKKIHIFNHATFRTFYGKTPGGIGAAARSNTKEIVERQWEEYESIGIRKYFTYRFNDRVDFYDFKINNVRTLEKACLNL